MILKEKIRIARKKRGLTLKDIQEMTGLSVPFLSEIERGVSKPSLNSLGKIAQALETSIQELLEGIEIKETDEMPEGLKEACKLINISPEWVRTLKNISYRGNQPKTPDEWIQLYISLRGIFKK